jgi:predicted CoA-substrate-specific enzyme activase
MKRLGIDLGSSAVKLALLDKKGVLLKSDYRLHHGSLLPVLGKLLLEVREEWLLSENSYVLICGIESGLLDLPAVGDIVALTEGAKRIAPSAAAVIAIGGQSARYITGLNDEIPQFAENDSCASGTGSFFENQMARLGLPLTEYSNLVKQANTIPRIAGRCSVFAKTDIIHHQQEGVPAADILLGLCYASVRSYKAAVAGKLKVQKPVLLACGVGHNSGVVRAIRDVFELGENELLLPDGFDCTQAIGAAAIANKQGVQLSFQNLIELCEKADVKHKGSKVHTLPPLPAPPSVDNLHKTRHYVQGEPCYLGIDVGSTTTKLVLLSEDENVLETIYLRIKGDPKQAVREGFARICEKYGDGIRIKAASTTGSGRMLIGRLIGADCIKDEITAQTTSAVRFTPDADTVFEIGGQDSKYISLRDGHTGDFQMNKICAAGTGSFVEEQAAKLDIPLAKYGDMALAAAAPADLGERCTVFIESRIASLLSTGISRENIAAGLCHSIVLNYLNRVVGTRIVGNHIVLQGGVAYNPGIVAAFISVYGNRISVAPYFSVSGAVGAALLAKREIGDKVSTFKGITFNGWDENQETKSSTFVKQKPEPLDSLDEQTFPREKGKKTIGIPRALINYDMFPRFSRFFHALGYNVLLSDISSDATVELGQANVKEEVCYPLKLAVGHAASLVQQKVDYLLMPSVHGKGICVYMQEAPQIIAACVGLKEKGIKLLAPDICMDQPKYISTAFTKMAKQLGHGRLEVLRALFKCGIFDIASSMLKRRSEPLPVITKNEIGFVLVSRSYGLADPILSLSIKQKLNSLGYKVYDLPSVPSRLRERLYNEQSRSNLYWPFGREVLAAARQLRQNPKLYPIYLTYHGCGPDTMLTHWFDIEVGGKPYLAIEVDEHSSTVGIMTRLEAFANSVVGRDAKKEKVSARISALSENSIQCNIDTASKKIPLAIPSLYPYSTLLTDYLIQKGYRAKEMSPTSLQSLAKGHVLMRGKEYFSLTALLADCIEYTSKNNMSQILIPQNKGAENNGLYARFIATKLAERGFGNTTVIAPVWERLMKDNVIANALFSVSLAGDIILCAPVSKQAKLLSKVKAVFASGLPAKEDFIKWAQFASGDINSKYILCAGESACFLNPLFRSELEAHCEKAGYTLRYAPLSELLLIEMMENGVRAKEKAVLLSQISAVLGAGSPFAGSVSRLSKLADSVLGSCTACNGRCAGCSIQCNERICECRTLSAGGRWRAGKTASLPNGYHGLIRVTSMYENTSSVFSLIDGTLGAQRLELRFEGTLSAAESARVDTWLHYIN